MSLDDDDDMSLAEYINQHSSRASDESTGINTLLNSMLIDSSQKTVELQHPISNGSVTMPVLETPVLEQQVLTLQQKLEQQVLDDMREQNGDDANIHDLLAEFI